MEEMRETYNLETLEQLRAVADELRLRILEQLKRQPMTVTQLAGVLGEVPAKLHYHVHELEKVGLLKLVETREKGGILEKYYRAVAKNINAPGTLFQGVSPHEAVATLTEVIQPLFQGVIRAFQQMLSAQAWDDPDLVLQLSPEHYWMTAQEFDEFSKRTDALLAPYTAARGIAGERERTVLRIAYDTVVQTDGGDVGPAPEAVPLHAPGVSKPTRAPKRELTFVAGAAYYSRRDLEKLLARSEVLDMYVLGACIFADDVPPDLVERAIYSFHLWGKLTASPEVREVLRHKGGEPGKK
ncbi:MAG TPA: helix-turn-helix domain-containing protein [Ktedonobacterales bacterium]|jgi:DNA-binding transcriptional ArsR family regulator